MEASCSWSGRAADLVGRRRGVGNLVPGTGFEPGRANGLCVIVRRDRISSHLTGIDWFQALGQSVADIQSLWH